MPTLRILCLSLVVATCWCGKASGQRRPAWFVVADNDYFNFWQDVSRRPDVEYSQGLHFGVALPVGPRKIPRWIPTRWICAALTERCPWITLGLSQEIYTPSVDAPVLQPGQRPYAGWLALRLGWGQHTRRSMETIDLAVGVTGPPSLAEFAQTRMHRLLSFRAPLGWSGQLPAEPGFFVTYARALEVWGTSSADVLGFRLGLLGVARAGTIHVDGAVGANATFGIRPAAPRPIDLSRPSGRVALYVSTGAQIEAVARNEFLQGTLFRSSPGVPLRHFVPQASLGFHARLGRVSADWTVTYRGREYPTQPKPHTYSSLGLRIAP